MGGCVLTFRPAVGFGEGRTQRNESADEVGIQCARGNEVARMRIGAKCVLPFSTPEDNCIKHHYFISFCAFVGNFRARKFRTLGDSAKAVNWTTREETRKCFPDVVNCIK